MGVEAENYKGLSVIPLPGDTDLPQDDEFFVEEGEYFMLKFCFHSDQFLVILNYKIES